MTADGTVQLIDGDTVTDNTGREWVITITDDAELLIAVGHNADTNRIDVVEATTLPCPVSVTRAFTHIEGM